MNSKKFSEAMGEIGDKYLNEAISYQKKRKNQSWIKWASIAACFCIIVGTVFVTTQKPTNSDVTGYYTDESQQLIVELVAWQGEGFTATVVDERNNNVFPLHSKLLVFFEENTEVVLCDGTTFGYTPREPNAEAIGWEAGQLVLVEFFGWEEYAKDKGFFNRLYAAHVEVISDIEDIEPIADDFTPINNSTSFVDMDLTINEILTDGIAIQVNFTIDELTSEDVVENLSFKFDISTAKAHSHTSIAITPIEMQMPNGEMQTHYSLSYTILGLNESLIGEKATLIADYNGEEQEFSIQFNEDIEIAEYTMPDGTKVICSPISIFVEKTNYFYSETAKQFLLELTNDRYITLPRGVSFESGDIDENEEKLTERTMSATVLTEQVNPNEVVAIWLDDIRYELTS